MNPDNEQRPRRETETVEHNTSRGGDDTTITAPATFEHATRAGSLVREVQWRRVDAHCEHCGRDFQNTGTAASHARSSRHTVTVDYRALFVFIPAERLPR